MSALTSAGGDEGQATLGAGTGPKPTSEEGRSGPECALHRTAKSRSPGHCPEAGELGFMLWSCIPLNAGPGEQQLLHEGHVRHRHGRSQGGHVAVVPRLQGLGGRVAEDLVDDLLRRSRGNDPGRNLTDEAEAACTGPKPHGRGRSRTGDAHASHATRRPEPPPDRRMCRRFGRSPVSAGGGLLPRGLVLPLLREPLGQQVEPGLAGEAARVRGVADHITWHTNEHRGQEKRRARRTRPKPGRPCEIQTDYCKPWPDGPCCSQTNHVEIGWTGAKEGRG